MQSHKDENNASGQHDTQKPRKQSQELPATTPDVSKRTEHAQYPLGNEVAERGVRDNIASGWPAIYETFKYAAKHSATRTLYSLLVVNKKGGFDCPSCAWPEPDGVRHPAEFCENGAKAVAWEATSKKCGPGFFAEHSIAELASKTERWLGDQGRITHPMVLKRGSQHYEPIEWSDAFKMIADELNGMESPNQALFYTSGRASNEAAFVYQLFARQFGTNNLPDCSNMCHESTSVGLSEVIGIGKGTVTLDDFNHADCILIIGQNPGTNHPRMLTALEKAVENGCKIISINPLPETGMIRFKHPQSPVDMLGRGTAIASIFVPLKINSDVAALTGIMKRVLELDQQSHGQILHRAFIDQKTQGFDDFVRSMHATTWEQIEHATGVTRTLLETVGDVVAKSERLMTCWAMGLTQHKNGVANVQSIVNLHLLRGMFGKKGAGVCPVRGHSNVQGDRTVGIWEKMSDQFLENLGKEFHFNPPQEHGHDAVNGLQAMHEGRIKVFVGLGGNFLSATPDTEYGADAFRRTKLSVQISTKLNRNHLITGEQALILPCRGRTEIDEQASGPQFVTCENSMGVVQESRGRLKPAGKLLMSETAIVCHLAAATLKQRSTVDWMKLCGNYDHIRDHIEQVVPGFDDYNKRVREPGGFYLPNATRDKQEFHTGSGKAHFTVNEIPKWDLPPGRLLMMSIRSHDQFNTTIYGENDRYRGVYGGRRVIFLNADDMNDLGLVADQWVDITSHYEDELRTVRQFKIMPYPIPRGCAATYYPETNPLVPLRHVADGSNQPASKSVIISLAPCAVPEAALNSR